MNLLPLFVFRTDTECPTKFSPNPRVRNERKHLMREQPDSRNPCRVGAKLYFQALNRGFGLKFIEPLPTAFLSRVFSLNFMHCH